MFDQRVSVTVDDAAALTRDARYVKGVVPELTRNLRSSTAGRTATSSIVATTPNYTIVQELHPDGRRMFTPAKTRDAAFRRTRLGDSGDVQPQSGRDYGQENHRTFESAWSDGSPRIRIGQQSRCRSAPHDWDGVVPCGPLPFDAREPARQMIGS